MRSQERVLYAIVVAILVALAISACATPTPERTLHVAAASSLAPLMDDLLNAYEHTSSVRVVPVIGSSGKLAQQIANGAPYDVFMSANRAYVQQLQQQGVLLPGSRVVYASGVLVLAFPRDRSLALDDLSDITREDIVRVAMANPEVAPYGLAAQQALQRSGLWDDVKDKLVIAETVRQATQFLETGNVDAALIALSTVNRNKAQVILVAPSLYDPILQEAAVIARSPNQADARAFLDFLRSPEAQAIFTQYGFRVP